MIPAFLNLLAALASAAWEVLMEGKHRDGGESAFGGDQ